MVQVRFLRNNWRRKGGMEERWKQGKKYSEFYTLCQTSRKKILWPGNHTVWVWMDNWQQGLARFRAEIGCFPMDIIVYTILKSWDGASNTFFVFYSVCLFSFFLISWLRHLYHWASPISLSLYSLAGKKKCGCCCLDGLKLIICIFSLC